MERFLPRLRMPLARLWTTLLFVLLSLTTLAQRPFITTWQTTAANESITIPVNTDVTGYNYTVEWGDGNTDAGQTGDAMHTYGAAGTYTVSISGDFPAIGLGFHGIDVTEKLMSIEQWGDIAWTSMRAAFSGASNMVLNATDAPNLSGVSSLARMFFSASSFNSDLSGWNVSGITDMSHMFNGASAFNGNISGWNVSNVTNMYGMLWQASMFNQNIGGWNVSQVENMSYMFYSAADFNQDLSGWTTSNVTNVESMFAFAIDFDQSLGNWDISGVTDMEDMLLATGLSSTSYGATLIGWAPQPVQTGITLNASGQTYCPGTAASDARQQLIGKGWTITGDAEATDCGGGGTIITPGDPGNFVTVWRKDDFSSGDIVIPTHPDETYNYAIYWEGQDGVLGSGSATDVIGDFTIPTDFGPGGTVRVEIAGEFPRIFLQKFGDDPMSEFAEVAGKLLSVEQWGDIAWTSMAGAFHSASNLQVNATDIPDLSRVTSLVDMFNRASAFTGHSSMADWDVRNITNMGNMFISTQFDQSISEWDVSNVTDMQSMFTSTPFNQDISEWDVGEVTTMHNMFAVNSAFNQDIGDWEVGKVTDMQEMFRGAIAFNQDLSGWDVSNVTSMWAMFLNAVSFNQDIGDWDVSKVTDMYETFRGATAFNQDLSSWDVSNVTSMSRMLDNSALSRENYDATLIGWAGQTVQNNVTLGADGLEYCASTSERQSLIDDHGWTISGDTQATDCDDDGTVITPGDPGNFVTTWKTDNSGDSEENQITIPIHPDGGYNFTIAWGDGNQTTWQDGDDPRELTHTYATPGTYTVEITGDFPRIFFNGGGDRQKILSIEQWGAIAWSSMEDAFNAAVNVMGNATDAPDLSGVTSLARMFWSAGVFNADIGNWDVSGVTTMAGMFAGANSFNQDIGSWDVSNVTNMDGLFVNAHAFNQDISSWQVGNVTSMISMFRNASEFSQDISGWDVADVTVMQRMFFNTPAFNVNLGDWDVSKVTDMLEMLSGSGLSRDNYDATLIGWAGQTVQSGITLGADGLEYCASASERQSLIDDRGWTIDGDVQAADCDGGGAVITPGENNILYVDINVDTEATGYTGAGDSWANAVPQLADALKWAREQHDGGSPGWTEAEPLRIFVAKGTYLPVYSAADAQYTTDGGRDNSFVLVANVQLYGGFDPSDQIETLEDARILPDVDNPWQGTILSADLAGDDNEDDFGNHAENVRRVLISTGDVGQASIDGFTITGGNANAIPPFNNISVNGVGVQYFEGGGMYIGGSSPTLSRIAFIRNSASHGGGVFIEGHENIFSYPLFDEVIISGNVAGGDGGGIYTINRVSANFKQLVISDNEAGIEGGGIFDRSVSPSVFTNVTISRNTAGEGGGGIANHITSTFTNAIIWANEAGGSTTSASASILNNSTSAIAIISHSLVANSGGSENWNGAIGTDAGNNIDANPEFVSTTPGTEGYLQLSGNSPAISAGSNVAYTDAGGDLANDLDLAGNPRVYNHATGGVIDMGAYEFQGELAAMQIHVETWTGETITLDVELSDAIQQVKQKIRAEIGIPWEQQILLFNGAELENGRTLADYDIEYGNTLQLLSAIIPDENNILYVDINVDTEATGYTGAGDSWANAIPELADALNWAREQHDEGTSSWTDTEPLRVFVAKGEYKPLYNAADGQYTADGGRKNSFVLVANVQLYGGFDPLAGIETLEHARILPDREADVMAGTVLNGDLNGDDAAEIPLMDLQSHATRQDNAQHVVLAAGEVGTARLDGFTVTGGKAEGYSDGLPALQVNNTTIYNDDNGGGISTHYSSPTISHIVLTGNSTEDYGGGMASYRSPALKLSHVIFSGNSARAGGGMSTNDSSPTLTNVLFVGNEAETGGGITIGFSSPKLSNVTITDNSAQNGGGMEILGSSATITNMIIWGNEASGSTTSAAASIYYTPGQPSLIPTISYSLIANMGGRENWDEELAHDGGGNIDADPIFVSTTPGEAGYLQLAACSPAISVGNNQAYTDADGDLANDLDLAGNPRVYNATGGGVIDMGAFEYQGERVLIQSLTMLDAMQVSYGTALEDVAGLPTAVTATLSDDTEVSIPLDDNLANWILASPADGAYNGDVAGTYVFTVPLLIPETECYLNPDDLQAEVNIVVAKGTPVLAASWNGAAIDATDGLSLTYGDLGELAFSKTDTDGVLTAVFGDDDTPVLNLADLSAVAAQQAGTATLTIVQEETDNFEAAAIEIAVAIGPKAITIVPTAGQGKVYGADEPTAYGYELADDDALAFDDELTDIVSGASREAGEDVGAYDIELVFESDQADNYAITFEADNNAFVVTPLEITVTAEDKTKVFGSDDPALTYTFTPELIGEDAFEGDLDREEGEDVGTYAITQGNLSLGANYKITFGEGTLTITPADYEGVEFNDGSFVYDGMGHVIELTGELPEGASVTYQIDGEAGNGAADAGIYEITAIIDGGENYADTEVTATLTISPLEITVTAANRTKVFGADDPALTYTFMPELIGEDAFEGDLGREEGETVGGYIITRGDLSLDDNYEITFEPGTLTIKPADYEGVEFNDGSFVYDGTKHVLELTGELPEGASVTYEINGEAGNGATDAGTYEITALIDGGSNYEDNELTATLTITPLEVTVTAANKTKVFGTDDPALTYTFTPELIGDDTFTGWLTREEGEVVLDYAITQGDLSAGDNYTITFKSGTLTIVSAGYEGIAFNNTSFTYDGTEHRLTLAGKLPAGASVTYENNGRTNVGSQTVTARIAGGENYKDVTLTAELEVTPLAITVTADDKRKIVGADDPELTYMLTPELIGNDVFMGELAREEGETVGTYVITQGDLSAGDNYAITFEPGTLTITQPVPPTEITGIALEDATFPYDGTEHKLSIAGDLPEGASVTYEKNGRTNAGSQTVTATMSGEGYETLVLTATLTVAPAARSIDFPALPEKTYGDAEFDAYAVASSGEEVTYTSENRRVADISADGMITITGAGEAVITATVPENGNYTSHPRETRTLVVHKAPQTITFDAPTEVDRDAGSVQVDVSASSGLSVSLTIDDEQVATLGGSTLNILRLGTIQITAMQAGDANYEAAERVTVTVRVVDPGSDLPVRVHPVISPNGDGINEFLMIEAIKDYPENRVTIFNRNGTLLWEASGYDNNRIAFRGISTGQLLLPAGTYFYIVEVKDNGTWKHKKGYFVLRY